MTIREMADDLHATVRREIVAGLGSFFEPHRSDNPLDVFLGNYDKNAPTLWMHVLTQAQAAMRERAALEGKVAAYSGVMDNEKASDVGESVYLRIRALEIQ